MVKHCSMALPGATLLPSIRCTQPRYIDPETVSRQKQSASRRASRGHCCFSIYDYVCQLRAAYLSNTKCPFLAYSHKSMHAIGVQQRASCSAAWQFWRGGFRDTAALAHAAGPQSVLHPVATSPLPVVLPTHCCNAVSLAPGLRCC